MSAIARPTLAELDVEAANSLRYAVPLVRKPMLTWEPGQGAGVAFLVILNLAEYGFLAWQILARHA